MPLLSTFGAASARGFGRGELKVYELTYEIIGAGGGGGAGDTSSVNGQDGEDSTITLLVSGDTSTTTITSSGGEGGLGGHQTGWGDGENSYYGNGGQTGDNSDTNNQTAGDAPAVTAYGAGGGGGGAHTFAERNGGVGGGAGGTEGAGYTVTAWNSSATLQRNVGMPSTGTILIRPRETVDIVIGEGGAGGTGFTQGAKGANGYCKITVDGVETEYTAIGSHTYTVPA